MIWAYVLLGIISFAVWGYLKVSEDLQAGRHENCERRGGTSDDDM